MAPLRAYPDQISGGCLLRPPSLRSRSVGAARRFFSGAGDQREEEDDEARDDKR
jgi:hypothetical protein